MLKWEVPAAGLTEFGELTLKDLKVPFNSIK